MSKFPIIKILRLFSMHASVMATRPTRFMIMQPLLMILDFCRGMLVCKLCFEPVQVV